MSVDDAVALLFPEAEIFPSAQMGSEVAHHEGFSVLLASVCAPLYSCPGMTASFICEDGDQQDDTPVLNRMDSAKQETERIHHMDRGNIVDSACFALPDLQDSLQPVKKHTPFNEKEHTTTQLFSLGADQCHHFARSPQVVTRQESSPGSEHTPIMKRRARAWTSEEHTRFLKALDKLRTDKTEGIDKNGKQTTGLGPGIADTIAAFVQTRNAAQVRSHAQKHFQRLRRERDTM